MKTEKNPDQLEHRLRIPAYIVYIALPLLCCGLLAFRWCGLWLTKPWMLGVIVFYYTLAAAYLAFSFFVRMRVIEIVGLLLFMVTGLFMNFFMWIPYHWVLTVFLFPALFMAFWKRGNKSAAAALTAITSIMMLMIILLSLFFGGLTPEKYTYHFSPDGHYVAFEHAFTQIPGGTDVLLCRAYGPLLVKKRVLYLANYSDFGGAIEWLDDSTIVIYGDKMDVFKDPEIKNYDYF